jgi:hypothetical protein
MSELIASETLVDRALRRVTGLWRDMAVRGRRA